ncbi:MAG TPA: YtxH domain-containing protein [Flavobacteriaceae bacterium]|mgnify:CR=1 FL=1|nr:YtxH domain-containing protein [Flavobacteriaceae bacterium]MCB9212251.1 YtxH domain-containing protein [Alteromonas sp.]HPF10370.1 YtxH domain-containing protein [Flavobacteriaceae bacterium]HQU20434.1 YtxH domain-containing protein [Flavobacteriaceae bacterium]HQU66537.1 YtxH domain-containing protein [Flavobacteriaceae bacterium]
MSKTANVITGIVSGLAVGATIGILFAPDKGSKTRKKIKKSALDSKDAIVAKTQEITDQISKTFHHKKHEFSEELDKMVSDMSYKADDVIAALEQKLAKLKKENESINMN